MSDYELEKKETVENIEKKICVLNKEEFKNNQEALKLIKSFTKIKDFIKNENSDELKVMQIIINLPILYVEVDKIA